MVTTCLKSFVVPYLMVASAACAETGVNEQVHSAAYPAAAAAGNWVADVKMLSSSSKRPDSDYWWVGKMWGHIEPSGKFDMRTENGCTANGVITRKSYQGLTGEIMLSGCQQDSMNRRYMITATGGPVDGRGNAMLINFDASQNGGGPGLLDVWRIEGAFAKYHPSR